MRVSYVIPSKDSVAWLAQAVRSVFEQDYPKELSEVVVVNDGSTDSTRDYLSWLMTQDFKVKVIHNSTSIGRSGARNIGNAESSGDVVCVLDADDLALPSRSRLTVKAFENGATFVHGGAQSMDCLGNRYDDIETDVLDPESARKNLLHGIVHSTVAYNRDFIEKYPYPTEGPYSELGLDDWHQQARAIQDGVEFTYIPNNLSVYRHLSQGISKTRDEEEVKKAKEAFWGVVA